MAVLRWVEREEVVEWDAEGNPLISRTVKILQQHQGNFGWMDVPTEKESE